MTKYSTCGVSICCNIILAANQPGGKKYGHCFYALSGVRGANALCSIWNNEVILCSNGFSSPVYERIVIRGPKTTAKPDRLSEILPPISQKKLLCGCVWWCFAAGEMFLSASLGGPKSEVIFHRNNYVSAHFERNFTGRNTSFGASENIFLKDFEGWGK